MYFASAPSGKSLVPLSVQCRANRSDEILLRPIKGAPASKFHGVALGVQTPRYRCEIWDIRIVCRFCCVESFEIYVFQGTFALLAPVSTPALLENIAAITTWKTTEKTIYDPILERNFFQIELYITVLRLDHRHAELRVRAGGSRT